MHKDLYNNSAEAVALDEEVFAADAAQVGNIIDIAGFESALIILQLGTVTTGNISITSITESDDSGMSGEVAIPAARILGTVGTLLTVANTLTSIGVVASKRYIRVTYTTADTAADLVGTSIIVKSDPNFGSTR